ncbi:CLUMA_CG000364, isoform A [Clunio marinus]|uniref:CLUMA_CG000364, isoform A n=1 Tax=Clunio marinus TaxID=568069 RepID=A0A1J1HEL3_9DIPT|nr:CLUMA_CG000364, isoform A [Clunio marinus]
MEWLKITLLMWKTSESYLNTFTKIFLGFSCGVRFLVLAPLFLFEKEKLKQTTVDERREINAAMCFHAFGNKKKYIYCKYHILQVLRCFLNYGDESLRHVTNKSANSSLKSHDQHLQTYICLFLMLLLKEKASVLRLIRES